MRQGKNVLCLAWTGLLLSSFPAQAIPARGQQATGSEWSPAEPAAGQQWASGEGLPDSPGAIRSRLQEQESQQSTAQSTQLPAVLETAKPQPPAQSLSSLPTPQKPVGTAAASPATVSGMAASQPAGAAIAPAKQHRARTILIRVGAIVGAGAAVGTVVALTRATPSKPPGAR